MRSSLNRTKSVTPNSIAPIGFSEIKIVDKSLRVAALFVYIMLEIPVEFETDFPQRYFTPIVNIAMSV